MRDQPAPDLAGFGDVGRIRSTSRVGIAMALAGAASYGINIVAARITQQQGLGHVMGHKYADMDSLGAAGPSRPHAGRSR